MKILSVGWTKKMYFYNGIILIFMLFCNFEGNNTIFLLIYIIYQKQSKIILNYLEFIIHTYTNNIITVSSAVTK